MFLIDIIVWLLYFILKNSYFGCKTVVEDVKDRPEGVKLLPGPGELLILTDASIQSKCF